MQISCTYHEYKPYLSFEVDGLRAQTFAPLPGKHWYSVFLHLNPNTVHRVQIIKESQAFENDRAAGCILLKGRTDGVLEPLAPRKRKIEFIGDSLTSGEGGRGPRSFMEWVPMCFNASDNYPRLVADQLDAQYQLVSQSGWGVHCGWNNDPHCRLPRFYDQICGPQAGETPEENWGSGKPYDFSFQPDDIVIALGANDRGALLQPPFVDPITGRDPSFTIRRRICGFSKRKSLRFLSISIRKTRPPGSRGFPIIWIIPSFRRLAGPSKGRQRKESAFRSAQWTANIFPPRGREAAIIRGLGSNSRWRAKWFAC